MERGSHVFVVRHDAVVQFRHERRSLGHFRFGNVHGVQWRRRSDCDWHARAVARRVDHRIRCFASRLHSLLRHLQSLSRLLVGKELTHWVHVLIVLHDFFPFTDSLDDSTTTILPPFSTLIPGSSHDLRSQFEMKVNERGTNLRMYG